MSINIDIQNNLLPNVLTLITQLLATFLIYLIFKKFLWKPVTNILEKRSDAMQSELDSAKKLQEEANEHLEKAKQEINEAKESGNRILENAKREADNLRDSIIKDAEHKAKNKLEEANEKILKHERDVRESLKEETVKIAMEAVAKLLDEKSGSKDDMKSLENFIEQESKDK